VTFFSDFKKVVKTSVQITFQQLLRTLASLAPTHVTLFISKLILEFVFFFFDFQTKCKRKLYEVIN